MGRQFQFRQLTLNDLDALETNFPQPESISHAGRLRMQSSRGRTLYGFFIKNKLVAIGQIKRLSSPENGLSTIEKYPEVCSLYVIPEKRRAGLGENMMRKLEHILRLQGYTHTRLSAGPENHIAQRLYEKLGYSEAPTSTKNSSLNPSKLYFIKKL